MIEINPFCSWIADKSVWLRQIWTLWESFDLLTLSGWKDKNHIDFQGSFLSEAVGWVYFVRTIYLCDWWAILIIWDLLFSKPLAGWNCPEFLFEIFEKCILFDFLFLWHAWMLNWTYSPIQLVWYQKVMFPSLVKNNRQ